MSYCHCVGIAPTGCVVDPRWSTLGKSTREASVRWTAPERFQGGIITGKADVYSYGVVIWEFMSAVKPCPNPRNQGKKPEDDKFPFPFCNIEDNEEVS